MNNLITNLQNPEFLKVFKMQMLDATTMCTCALCCFFMLICLQGQQNKITWKRVGLFYLVSLLVLIGILISGMCRIYEGEYSIKSLLGVYLLAELANLYYPILIACFYKKSRIRIGLKAFLFNFLLVGTGSALIVSYQKILQDTGQDWSEVGNQEYMSHMVQMAEGILEAGYIATIILCVVLIILMYFGLYKRGTYLKLHTGQLIMILVWPMVVNGISSILSKQVESVFVIWIRYCLIGMLLIVGMLLPTLFVLSSFRRQLTEKNKAQELYLESELAYIEQYKKSQEKTRAFRHDIKNNFSLLQYMLKEGKVAEASGFLEEMSGQMKEMSPQYITGDEMLDCIVAMKADKMSEMGIDFSLDGVLDGGLHMKPMEVCTIFANILDNAIEATGKVEDTDKRWISMTLKRSGQFWVINVGNSTDRQPDIDKIQAGGYTSKEDKGHHGFGLLNIRQTVEKQDGILKLETKEDAFSLTVMLPKVG